MNNLFGFGSTLGDLAKDINGFVREVVDELQTVATQDESENNNNENDTEFDEEQAIEEELRHQLLQLSDDEYNGSTIRDIDFDELKENESNQDEIQHKEQPENQPENATDKQPDVQSEKQEQEQKQEQKEQFKSLEEYNNLYEKYMKLKQHYRKSISLVEKYQIYNKSLKETLNEQMIIREQQQLQINQQKNKNDELNQKIINLQNEIETIQIKQKTNGDTISIFEDDKMVIKSVTIKGGTNISAENDNEMMSKSEGNKLRKTLQKASTNMKELKKRYKKVKDDLCNKIEEFDQLKSQYVTYKISNSNKLQELKNKLKNNINNGLNKELQTILNAKFIEYGICKVDMINPLHLEMIGILNGCIETMAWISNNSGIQSQKNIDDSKSDSVIIINDTIDIHVNELQNIKINVVSLREVVCEFIAGIQQWLKVLVTRIEHEDGRKKSFNAEEFQNID